MDGATCHDKSEHVIEAVLFKSLVFLADNLWVSDCEGPPGSLSTDLGETRLQALIIKSYHI